MSGVVPCDGPSYFYMNCKLSLVFQDGYSHQDQSDMWAVVHCGLLGSVFWQTVGHLHAGKMCVWRKKWLGYVGMHSQHDENSTTEDTNRN